MYPLNGCKALRFIYSEMMFELDIQSLSSFDIYPVLLAPTGCILFHMSPFLTPLISLAGGPLDVMNAFGGYNKVTIY